MVRRIIDGVSIVLLLAGAFLVHPGLLMMLLGLAGLFAANRMERTVR